MIRPFLYELVSYLLRFGAKPFTQLSSSYFFFSHAHHYYDHHLYLTTTSLGTYTTSIKI